MLKGEGTLLNHIRPYTNKLKYYAYIYSYHLLSFNDFNFVLKVLPKEELDLIHPNVLKITPQRYNYVSADAWCALFYQIVKVYGLARVNFKNFKTLPGMPSGEKTTLPDYYLHGSNLYSREEGVLMRWLEVHYE